MVVVRSYHFPSLLQANHSVGARALLSGPVGRIGRLVARRVEGMIARRVARRVERMAGEGMVGGRRQEGPEDDSRHKVWRKGGMKDIL